MYSRSIVQYSELRSIYDDHVQISRSLALKLSCVYKHGSVAILINLYSENRNSRKFELEFVLVSTVEVWAYLMCAYMYHVYSNDSATTINFSLAGVRLLIKGGFY